MRRAGFAFAVLFAASAFAAKEESLEQARKLVLESRPFVEQANDVDRSIEERKDPRREAFQRLKSARGLFDQYLDANPSMEDRIDKEYVELNVLIYGLKKDSAIGELEKEKEAPPDLPPPKDASSASAPVVDPEAAKRQFATLKEFDAAHKGDPALLQQTYERFLR